MRMLMIDPPGPNTGLNVGLGYLSAALKVHGHEVLVLDLNNRDLNRQMGAPNEPADWARVRGEIAEVMKSFDPGIVGITVKTFTARSAAEIARQCKRHKNVPVVVGGAHPTLDGHNYLIDENLEFAISGEAEEALPALLHAIEHDEDPALIPGVLVRGDRTDALEKRSEFLSRLDEVIFPDYTTFTSVQANGGVIPDYSLLTSRGCPYLCTFCSISKIGGKPWRTRTKENILEELWHAKKTYGISRFHLVDDNFTMNPQRAIEICDQMLAEKLDLPWYTQNGIRADRSPMPVLKKMKEAGCTHIWFGVEAADPELFDTVKKGETLEDIENAIKNVQECGMHVGGFFIVGLPYSTYEKDMVMVEWVRKMGIQGWFFLFSPYPHTESWDYMKEHGRFLKSFLDGQQYGQGVDPVVETPEYPADERIRAYYRIHFELGFYDNLTDRYKRAHVNARNILKAAIKYQPSKVPAVVHFLTRKYGSWWVDGWKRRLARLSGRAAAL